MLSFNVVVSTPYMTYEEFSQLSGISKRTLIEWQAEGKLPIKKKVKPKEKPLVNMIALKELAARETIDWIG